MGAHRPIHLRHHTNRRKRSMWHQLLDCFLRQMPSLLKAYPRVYNKKPRHWTISINLCRRGEP
jgi:hypothetical protein